MTARDGTTRRCVVVTGAAQGIGRGIAVRLAADGWRVWCVDVKEDGLRQVVRDITAGGGDAVWATADLADPSAVEDVWRQVDDRRDDVGAVVNNAGIFVREPALDMTVTDWDRVLAVNLRAPFLMAQHAVRRMVAVGRGGSVVSVASGQAFRPSSLGVSYAASKAALVNLGRALATEWGPLGIRVNTVVPGLTDTAQPRAAKSDADFERAAAQTPLRRLGTPEDVAALVSFLTSDQASYVTGQAYAVNGGRVML